MKRKVQQDKTGVYVQAKNRTYRPDTNLSKDVEYTHNVRSYLAQINEASDPLNLKDQPTEAEKGQEVTVTPSDYGVAAIDITKEGYTEQEQWVAEDVPDISEDTMKHIHENALSEKHNLNESVNDSSKKMNFLQSLIKENE